MYHIGSLELLLNDAKNFKRNVSNIIKLAVFKLEKRLEGPKQLNKRASHFLQKK